MAYMLLFKGFEGLMTFLLFSFYFSSCNSLYTSILHKCEIFVRLYWSTAALELVAGEFAVNWKRFLKEEDGAKRRSRVC